MTLASPVHRVRTVAWNRSPPPQGLRSIPEETAVALSYNGVTHAVMMATPLDLEDFAVGFSLSERQIERPDQIRELEIASFEDGVDLRIWLDDETLSRFQERRRRIVGPTGCGLCGVESLSEANPPPPLVDAEPRFEAAEILAGQRALFDGQRLHAETSAVHAAGWWTPADGLAAIREDVGRHNALDKLAGALARQGVATRNGLLLLTSRISVEMVQKAAAMGAPVIVAVSAPTALAVRTAERAGITLVAIARGEGFDIFTHPRRIAI